jgi:hypothetical protein
MLTLKHIKLGATLYILLQTSFLVYWAVDVMQMMGFFGGK